jgi:quinoprotein glucose dehydrogenase
MRADVRSPSLVGCAVSCAVLSTAIGLAQDGDWTAYGRDPGGERFSPLTQITRENVGSLQVAWTYRTGDALDPKRGRPTALEATPLHVDGTLFLSTPAGRAIALDPVTGTERWSYDAKVPRDAGWGDFASRGVSFWRSGDDRRIFFATVDARLIALDARTGTPIASFGDQGVVDLRKGLRIPPTGFTDYEVTSPPAVVGNTVIVGSGIADGTTLPHPSGEVRGVDAVTGKQKWSWDPLPTHPKTGGANAWSVIVADPARNLVFVPTSSPSHDYYGGERPGDNLYSDAVVALRADTGERVWHFQTVHHDLWDYDVAAPPILFDWTRDGTRVPAVAVASKTGHVFVLERATGKPLLPVEERPVPKSDVPGETASATQPFPTSPPSLARTRLTAADAWGASDEDREWCRTAMSGLRAEGMFTPPSLKGTLVIPGNVGGIAWGGLAFDRVNNLLITPVNNLAAEVRLIPRAEEDAERKAGRLSGEFEYHPQRGTPYGVVRRLLLSPKTGLPCTPPPWGTLAAIRAGTGQIAWQVPLGQLHGAGKIPAAADGGSIALGGPIVTAGGLVFAAGTLESAIYAHDVRTGERLWKGTLPTSARATPMTYLGRDGRQYVVIAAGGHGVPIGPPLGDHIVAFTVPK